VYVIPSIFSDEREVEWMPKTKLFIGSSRASIEVARLVGSRLEADGCGDAIIWDEGVFGLNQGVLDRLLSAANQFDFAILIWSGDDITDSKGLSEVSPRDNVIFECGLFMGGIGKDRVFIVRDKALT
jgi:predicted nucleotide-binding protein